MLRTLAAVAVRAVHGHARPAGGASTHRLRDERAHSDAAMPRDEVPERRVDTCQRLRQDL
eukprot:6367559-Prymnesium_polylepis.1